MKKSLTLEHLPTNVLKLESQKWFVYVLKAHAYIFLFLTKYFKSDFIPHTSLLHSKKNWQDMLFCTVDIMNIPTNNTHLKYRFNHWWSMVARRMNWRGSCWCMVGLVYKRFRWNQVWTERADVFRNLFLNLWIKYEVTIQFLDKTVLRLNCQSHDIRVCIYHYKKNYKITKKIHREKHSNFIFKCLVTLG
jgi:hypothetical protein